MSTVIQFEIEKFEGKINFSIWRVQMREMKETLDGKSRKLASTTDKQ